MNRKYDDHDNYLTPAAIQKMKDEIGRLERHVRPKCVEELSRAREMGDLSENAAYHDAKSRVAGIDSRLFTLKERIKNAILIEEGADSDGTVRIGCTVVVSVNGKERTYEITGSQETDPGSGKISHRSPVGAALLDHKTGDEVKVKSADGREITYVIEQVK